MNLSKKQILGMSLLFFIVIALLIATIYMFFVYEENPQDSGQIVQSTNEVRLNVNRTEGEEERVVNDIINDAITGNLDSYEDPLSKTTESKELTQESFDSYYTEILRFVSGKNFKSAQNLADLVYSEYNISNEDWLTFFITVSMISDFSADGESQQNFMSTVTDSQLYVLLFSTLEPTAQAVYLPRFNMTMLPNGEMESFNISSVDEGGTYYSEAYRYFSDFENTKVYKINLNYGSKGTFEVYYATNKNVGISKITNIINATPDIYQTSTYEDYFDFMGLEPDKIYYD